MFNTIKPLQSILILGTVTFLTVSISGCQKQLLVLNGCAIQPNTVCINANLDNLNLEGANLAGADLSGASFEGTNLKNTNFEGAILSQIKIGSESNLDGAVFKNSISVSKTNLIELYNVSYFARIPAVPLSILTVLFNWI